MVDVSVEALTQVKKSLSMFQTDIEGAISRIDNHVEAVLHDCRFNISQTQDELGKSESALQQLKADINASEVIINSSESDIGHVKEQQTNRHAKINDINHKIRNIHSEIVDLRSCLDEASDSEQRESILSQIASLQNMEQELSGMKSSINQEISALEHKEFELMRTMKAAKAQKAKSEMELDYETKHNDRLSNKLNKMERQYKSIETASSDYAQAAKKFESSTSTDVQKKKSAIDTCLISIESYLNISL